MTSLTSEQPSSISPVAPSPVDTGAIIQSPLRIYSGDDGRNHAAWRDLIDNTLIEWGRDPNQLDEEGTDSPSKETINRAIRFATRFGELNFAAPTRIVPDVHGGIVFESQDKDVFVSIHVKPDGTNEIRVFVNHRLVARDSIVDDV